MLSEGWWWENRNWECQCGILVSRGLPRICTQNWRNKPWGSASWFSKASEHISCLYPFDDPVTQQVFTWLYQGGSCGSRRLSNLPTSTAEEWQGQHENRSLFQVVLPQSTLGTAEAPGPGTRCGSSSDKPRSKGEPCWACSQRWKAAHAVVLILSPGQIV